MNDVVFTALFGKYEELNEINIPKKPNTRYVCFTDDENLISKTWEVIVVSEFSAKNAARKSREVKMLGHRYFSDGTRSLYIDNTVQLKVDGSEVLNACLNESDIAFMHHYSRRTVRLEFLAVAAYQLDSQEEIRRQFTYYKRNFPEILNQRPYWGGFIARVNSENTDKFMSTWKAQFDLYTRRDQLSINAASMISGVRLGVISGENDESNWHKWPIHNHRNNKMRNSESEKKFRKVRILSRALRYAPTYLL